MYRVITAAKKYSNKQTFDNVKLLSDLRTYLDAELDETDRAKMDPRYTELDVYSKRFKKNQLVELVSNHLQKQGYDVFVEVNVNKFTRLQVLNKYEYFVTLTVEAYSDCTTIYYTGDYGYNSLHEDWYEKYQSQKSKSVNASTYYDDEYEEDSMWEEIDHKSVQDYDGFYTDYTLYERIDEELYVCIFGDRDLYNPNNKEYDFETESRAEAIEWFEDYPTCPEELLDNIRD